MVKGRQTGFRIMRIVVFAFLFISLSWQSLSQTLPSYLAALQQAQTAPQFDSVFQEMIAASRQDKVTLGYEHMEEIVAIARDKSYRDAVLADVYRWAGTMFADGRMGQAILFFLESASLYQKQGRSVAEAVSFFEIAIIHHKAGNYREAREYYDKSLAIGGDSLDRRTIINCYNGIALILHGDAQYPQAMDYFTRAFDIAREGHDTAWIGILYGNMGNIYMKKEQYDSGLLYYLRDLAFIKKTSETENEIETYLNIGRVYLKKHQPQRALAYIDSTQYIIRQRHIRLNDFFNPMDFIHEAYAQVYAQLGDHKKAYGHFVKFHAAQEEKQARVKSKSLLQLQSTFEFQQKQRELKLLRQINEANEATIRQQRYAEAAFALIIVLLGAIAFMAYRTSRQRKNMNVKLHTANDELGRLNTVKDRLISVVSHDFRTPLSNVRMMLELQQGNYLEQGELQVWIASLNQQLKVSHDALEGLLAWAHAQLNAGTLVMEQVPLNDLVRKVATQSAEDLRRKNLTLEITIPEHLSVTADPNPLEIVIRNLLNNAIKFSYDHGTIRIHTSENEHTIALHVEDRGVGITEDDLRTLFLPNKTFTRKGTHNEKGTGIGLILSREIIQASGGDILAHSTPTQGSTFTIILPRTKE